MASAGIAVLRIINEPTAAVLANGPGRELVLLGLQPPLQLGQLARAQVRGPVSLEALGMALARPRHRRPGRVDLAPLAIASIRVSWLSVHPSSPGAARCCTTARPLGRRLQPARAAEQAGLRGPGADRHPFAATGHPRPAALRHALLSYLSGSVVLAVAVNLVAWTAADAAGRGPSELHGLTMCRADRPASLGSAPGRASDCQAGQAFRRAGCDRAERGQADRGGGP
jgi:hypothetical protein